MNEIIKFDNVILTFYDEFKETKVLDKLSFSINNGQIIAFIGPSGCGKSTILNLLAGLIKPQSGFIKTKEKIGYMFQKDNLLEWLNILDNVLIGLKLQKKLTKENKEYAKELLKKYGLYDFMKSKPSQLSGGMRQRVALIRALVTKPDLLLLDEPFSALDSQTRLNVSSDIYKIIKDFKITTILVTHDISEAISMADEIYILSKRPTKIIKKIEIKINELLPIQRRNDITFKDYFNSIWSEISNDDA